MAVTIDLQVRPAVFTDRRQIVELVRRAPHVHRHLDWRDPSEWIGSPPYLLAERQGQPLAALACPPDPPQVAWVRLFANSGQLPLEEAWAALWPAARAELSRKGSFLVAAIVLYDWYAQLLQASGFVLRQEIIMLERRGGPLPDLPAGASVRTMMPYDLQEVAEVDAAAFVPLWQNSLPALSRAYPQAEVATVAHGREGLLGYQISTRNPLGAHLARLAVRPQAQGRAVGSLLLADLIRQLAYRGIERLTVNTQSDNLASQRLYRKFSFHQTGESYPVFEYNV